MLTEKKREFIEFMLSAEVLRFGNFVTKSGRNTQYFVNTGNYKTGAQLSRLGSYYAGLVADAIGGMAPPRVVYVSCDPATLARDVKRFGALGYVPERAEAVDLFPWTGHVETVCLLSKLHANQHIEVELQMDELDLTAAESKATYEEIKEYVLKQSGLKVSNLYIAQVKQKCGIIERENYNLPKSENSRQPKCPPEKEAAIREALEHFRMI